MNTPAPTRPFYEQARPRMGWRELRRQWASAWEAFENDDITLVQIASAARLDLPAVARVMDQVTLVSCGLPSYMDVRPEEADAVVEAVHRLRDLRNS